YYNFPSQDTFFVNNDTLKIRTTSGDCMDMSYNRTLTITKDNGLIELNNYMFYAFSYSYSQTYTKTDVSGVNKNDMEAQNFAINQNYPNPFNPCTVIEYQVPVNGNVTVKVYDILGKEISTLVNGFKNKGKYTISFNGTSLTSGIYICKIQAGNYSKSIKMILMK
ncbi:MAG: T9SS type A sorting domain-containing protein, partial [Ignavibacteriaceae bacterium]|nr:T9SS type A sorting domain-containing protein [Ignavibacteriaceae bacterium]